MEHSTEERRMENEHGTVRLLRSTLHYVVRCSYITNNNKVHACCFPFRNISRKTTRHYRTDQRESLLFIDKFIYAEMNVPVRIRRDRVPSTRCMPVRNADQAKAAKQAAHIPYFFK